MNPSSKKIDSALQLIAIVVVIMTSFCTHAHELSNGYLSLHGKSNGELSGELLLKPKEIGQAAMLDINSDSKLTWGEVKAGQSRAVGYIQQHLMVKSGDKLCTMNIKPPNMRDISAQSLLVYPVSMKCNSSEALTFTYTGLMDIFPDHKLLLTVQVGDDSLVKVIDKDTAPISVIGEDGDAPTQFFEMVYQGVWHIFIGLDHILFLVATLLTVNLSRENRRWIKQVKKRHILKSTLVIVSTFTVAHSITLTATALDFFTLNSRLVELGIAISVVFTAFNNIVPMVMRLGVITFAFGLLHGMGFASVFADLQAQTGNLVISVFAFNLGVELGQLVIVAALLPALLLMRHWRIYARAIMPIASSVIAVVALNWTLQRW